MMNSHRQVAMPRASFRPPPKTPAAIIGPVLVRQSLLQDGRLDLTKCIGNERAAVQDGRTQRQFPLGIPF
jgi:hypothetical protein